MYLEFDTYEFLNTLDILPEDKLTIWINWVSGKIEGKRSQGRSPT